MRQALELARLGNNGTRPNPLVGCIIVRNGKVVGDGYHKKAGGDHAEVMALHKAGTLAKGADVYVTLDPCCHIGRTGRCTDALIQARVGRVFSSMGDPHDPSHLGEKILKTNNIPFSRGLLLEDSRLLNQIYLKNVQTSLPYVTLKMASTLDGKIATIRGFSKGITGLESRKIVHTLRASADAILTGSGTVLADDPHLGVRYVRGKSPIRVVVDSTLKIPLRAKIYRDNHVIVFTTSLATQKKLEILKKHGINVIVSKQKISLPHVLHSLFEHNIFNLFVECGSTLATALLSEGLVDRYIQFIAPKLLGGDESPTPFDGPNPLNFSNIQTLQHVSYSPSGDDLMVDGLLHIY